MSINFYTAKHFTNTTRQHLPSLPTKRLYVLLIRDLSPEHECIIELDKWNMIWTTNIYKTLYYHLLLIKIMQTQTKCCPFFSGLERRVFFNVFIWCLNKNCKAKDLQLQLLNHTNPQLVFQAFCDSTDSWWWINCAKWSFLDMFLHF